MEIPTIRTARLVLRPFIEQDAETLHAVLSETGVMRYFPNPKPPTREGVEKLITRQLKHWEERGYGWWAVEEREKSGIVGWNGLQYLPETEEIEVGYLLGKRNWGQGLATEGAAASLEWGFEELGLKEIIAVVHPENVGSHRVIEKLGMEKTGEEEYFGMVVYRYEVRSEGFRMIRAALNNGLQETP